MPYEKKGSITVTFQDGTEHEFTSIEKCAGLDPADVVEVDEVDADFSYTSTMPVQNKKITTALDDKADLEDGKVPSSQLPSYVDDVVEYPTLNDFPTTGEQGKIYLALDTGFTYRWSGSTYVRVNEPDLSNYYTKGQTDNLLAQKQDNITTTSVPDGENESFIGFDSDNELKKEKLLMMSPIEIINAAKGTYDPSKEYASLTVNDDPMSYGIVGGEQKSAVGDGNASLNKLVCVDVVKNQLVNPTRLLSGGSGTGYSWIKNSNGSITITVTDTIASDTMLVLTENNSNYYVKVPVGDIYFYDTNIVNSKIFFRNAYIGRDYYANRGLVAQISATSGYILLGITLATGLAAGTYVIDLKIVNVTRCYGNNDVVNAIIGTDADKQVERLLAFDPEILNDTDHDTGTLVPSKTAKLLSVGVNQWDEKWAKGYIGPTGAVLQDQSIYGTSFNPCIPGQTLGTNKYIRLAYYDKDKAFLYRDENVTKSHPVPNNANYFRPTMPTTYGATYKNDICINISDPNINGKYYPSKRNPIALPNYEGHGILKVVDGKVVADGDELYPDGTGKQRYIKRNLSELNWVSSDYGYYSQDLVGIVPRLPSGGVLADAICDKYPLVTRDYLVDTATTDCIAFSSNGTLLVRSTSVPNSGVVAVALATEEDISTTPFQSTFPVEHGGTLQFLDENDNPIAGLQGSEITYLSPKGE